MGDAITDDGKIVAQETVGDYWISTVRLSIDHGHGGTPLWYETMVFPQDDGKVTGWGELDIERYATEDEARDGHARMVARWSQPDPTSSREEQS